MTPKFICVIQTCSTTVATCIEGLMRLRYFVIMDTKVVNVKKIVTINVQKQTNKEWNQQLPNRATEHHKKHNWRKEIQKLKCGEVTKPNKRCADKTKKKQQKTDDHQWQQAFTRRATWEQWIHVLQTQNCLAAVIQNLQQKGEDYPGRAVGRAVGSCG